MKERSIPFNTPMVRAILAGTKTQTRRIVRHQYGGAPQIVGDGVAFLDAGRRTGPDQRCPYGAPGDRLYVKEAWRVPSMFDALPGSAFTSAQIWYEADDGYKGAGRYRHARFMPRWALRITLEVTDVRVERLEEISNDDAMAEGIAATPWAEFPPVDAYKLLWNAINAEKASWAANPWVWVVTFRRIAP